MNTTIPAPLLDYYRCPEGIPAFGLSEKLKEPNGFFRFGENVVCYGQAAGDTRAIVNGHLFDASQHVRFNGSTIYLPFNVNQVFDNLRYERYADHSAAQRWVERSWARDFYYRLRPMLPIAVRKHLQKAYLRGWDAMTFPSWPVDRSVDFLFQRLLLLAMKVLQTDSLPFIWFWPDGHQACAIVTHDVETTTGRDFCGQLMDIDDAFAVKASFQIVPEKRYEVPFDYLSMIRSRGFEINLHGLDHEGNLFDDRQAFLDCAKKINRYGELFGARGFRSPVLYRNIDWFQELDFSYDMTVPNVARLGAQRGGCCTVFPYFLPGNLTELPLTTTEDYSLFYILKDYSTTLWKTQINMILEAHGLISLIIHPDYVITRRAQDVYKSLLGELSRLRSDRNIWMTLPGEVDQWWRQRSAMKLVRVGQAWTIEGSGSERARVAYARRDGDRLIYEIVSTR